MRITQRAVALTSLQGLNRNLDAVGRLQQQLTSGRMISKPSDSPTATNSAMQTRGDITAGAQYSRNISDGKARLDATDTALTTMLAQVRRVRDLTVQAANTGALGSASNGAIAAEVDQIRGSLLELANQTMQGRPLFGGVTGGKAAYLDDGTYVGRGGATPADQVVRRVSDTEAIRVDITGAEAFGATPGADLFAVVQAISDAVGAGPVDPTVLGDQLTALDGVMNGMLTALADVGARAKRIEGAERATTDLALTLTSRLAETEDIDLPKTIMELEMQRTGYQAALAATAKALQPTLVDFLS